MSRSLTIQEGCSGLHSWCFFLSNALRDHADGRVVETEEISDCLKCVLVDAGGCVDPLARSSLLPIIL